MNTKNPNHPPNESQETIHYEILERISLHIPKNVKNREEKRKSQLNIPKMFPSLKLTICTNSYTELAKTTSNKNILLYQTHEKQRELTLLIHKVKELVKSLGQIIIDASAKPCSNVNESGTKCEDN